jgi:hypothetical protein
MAFFDGSAEGSFFPKSELIFRKQYEYHAEANEKLQVYKYYRILGPNRSGYVHF